MRAWIPLWKPLEYNAVRLMLSERTMARLCRSSGGLWRQTCDKRTHVRAWLSHSPPNTKNPPHPQPRAMSLRQTIFPLSFMRFSVAYSRRSQCWIPWPLTGFCLRELHTRVCESSHRFLKTWSLHAEQVQCFYCRTCTSIAAWKRMNEN